MEINYNEIRKLFLKFSQTRYLNEKEIVYRTPASYKNFKAKFLEKIYNLRRENGITVPLLDQEGANFWFYLNPVIEECLETIEKKGTFEVFELISPKLKKAALLDALVDEAFYSSVIEGAFSTKRRAKEIIEKKLEPADLSERMINNNHKALDYILNHLEKPLDEDMILAIYRILVEGTLKDDEVVEKYRTDDVFVVDPSRPDPIYKAPHHSKVQELMDSLVKFIRTEDDLHPVIKASIIHFYFVYIHPFFDGNGRTARAISYMYLLQQGYDFFKFFSISSVIKEEKAKYYKAIKDVEDYHSDLTYFICFSAEMTVRSINTVIERARKEHDHKIIESKLKEAGFLLSPRQQKAVTYHIKAEKNFTTISEYKRKFRVTYETARNDLSVFEALGIFRKSKVSRKFLYTIRPLEQILEAIEGLKERQDS